MGYSTKTIREIVEIISNLCGEPVSEDDAILAYEEMMGEFSEEFLELLSLYIVFNINYYIITLRKTIILRKVYTKSLFYLLKLNYNNWSFSDRTNNSALAF